MSQRQSGGRDDAAERQQFDDYRTEVVGEFCDSPIPKSSLDANERTQVAWPAGNSGVVSFFAPKNGVNGSLAIQLVNGSLDQPLHGVYEAPSANSLTDVPKVGISTLVHFNSSAVLTVPILGSIRTIRDFTEGPSLLHSVIQDALKFSAVGNGGAMLSRTWLDNKTMTQISFVPAMGGAATIKDSQLELEAGTYNFTATFDYAQLVQLSAKQVLNEQSQDLIAQNPDSAKSLSFLSYTNKLLAGGWRFLTYFGRDTMISLLLMQPVLSEGQGGAVEAVISAVLERLNRTSGVVCHEETIGDYATYTNLELNISSTAPSCTYIMIDTNYYLAPVMANYFVKTTTGQSRKEAFFSTKATTDFGNAGMTYRELALINAEMVMSNAAPFAKPGGQTPANLMHIEEDQIVGEWRDSTYGIGGGKIPYDVNTALVPAALRGIAALSAAGFFPEHPDWKTTAPMYAQVWEDNTLEFFQTTVPVTTAKSLLTQYTSEVGYGFPSRTNEVTSDVVFHGLSLDGNNGQALVKVMNTDDCFRHYLLNTTNQTQLTSFVNQTANNILRPYPAGLTTPQGMLVANPAFGGSPVYYQNWTHSSYHGTVIWSWPMAMMAAGLERQLGRCSSSSPPAFCTDMSVHSTALAAYNHLWDLIEANTPNLSTEVWGWTYQDGKFQFAEFGALPPPPGSGPTESDIRQLWSLSFLAVTRDMSLK